MHRRSLLFGLLAAPAAALGVAKAAAAPKLMQGWASGGVAELVPAPLVGEAPCGYLVPADYLADIMRTVRFETIDVGPAR